ncbi:MAG: DUF6893 family small protein [Acidimicrobiia bacterium]
MKFVGIVIGALFGALFVQSFPDLVRYIKIRSM